MAAMAIASMTRAERKGVQFDCSIMDLTAVSDSGGEQRSRRNKLHQGGPKKIDPAQKGRDQRLTFLGGNPETFLI